MKKKQAKKKTVPKLKKTALKIFRTKNAFAPGFNKKRANLRITFYIDSGAIAPLTI